MDLPSTKVLGVGRGLRRTSSADNVQGPAIASSAENRVIQRKEGECGQTGTLRHTAVADVRGSH